MTRCFSPAASRLLPSLIAGATAVLLSACGGGSSTDSGTPTPGQTQGTATLVIPTSPQFPHAVAVATTMELRDANGALLSGALTCTGQGVASDCSSVTGQSVGDQTITVSQGTVSAALNIHVRPQPHPFGTHGTVSSHGAGQVHTVVTTAGQVLMWGANPYGALGRNADNGTSAGQLNGSGLPQAVVSADGTSTLGSVASASGALTGGGALTDDGLIYTWGNDANNALGRNQANTGRILLPGLVTSTLGTGTLGGIVSMARGNANNVALADDGAVYAWGRYTGTTANQSAVPVRVPGPSGSLISDAKAVDAGWNWSMALLSDGRVLTWGFGGAEWLGWESVSTGTSANYVVDATGKPISDIVAISAGYHHGLALTSTGEVWAWGGNDYAELGQGTRATQTIAGARKVLSGSETLSGVTMIAAGGHHSAVLTSGGNVLTWGINTGKQLGDGPGHPRDQWDGLPAAVVGTSGAGVLGDVVAVASGYANSLALLADGRVVIWGDGFNGALGQGQITDSTDSPTPVFVKDSAGTGHLNLGLTSHWPNLTRHAR